MKHPVGCDLSFESFRALSAHRELILLPRRLAGKHRRTEQVSVVASALDLIGHSEA